MQPRTTYEVKPSTVAEREDLRRQRIIHAGYTVRHDNWVLIRVSKKTINILPDISDKRSQSALQLDDGKIVYDYPEQIPSYIKDKVLKLFSRPFNQLTDKT